MFPGDNVSFASVRYRSCQIVATNARSMSAMREQHGKENTVDGVSGSFRTVATVPTQFAIPDVYNVRIFGFDLKVGPRLRCVQLTVLDSKRIRLKERRIIVCSEFHEHHLCFLRFAWSRKRCRGI